MSVLAARTSVSVPRTIAAIDEVLARYDAHDVVRVGPAKLPTALVFELDTAWGPQSFRLPVNVARVQRRLRDDYPRSVKGSADHAAQVAWRQLYRWLESHLSAIDSGLFTAAQVLTPFLELSDGRNVFETIEGHAGVLALPAGASGDKSRRSVA